MPVTERDPWGGYTFFIEMWLCLLSRIVISGTGENGGGDHDMA